MRQPTCPRNVSQTHHLSRSCPCALSPSQDYRALNLSPEHFAPAAEVFLSYNASKDTIDKLFDEYDTDQSGYVCVRVCTCVCVCVSVNE